MYITSPPKFDVPDGEVVIGTLTSSNTDTTFSISGTEITLDGADMSFAEAPVRDTKDTYTATVSAVCGDSSVSQAITINII